MEARGQQSDVDVSMGKRQEYQVPSQTLEKTSLLVADALDQSELYGVMPKNRSSEVRLPGFKP